MKQSHVLTQYAAKIVLETTLAWINITFNPNQRLGYSRRNNSRRRNSFDGTSFPTGLEFIFSEAKRKKNKSRIIFLWTLFAYVRLHRCIFFYCLNVSRILILRGTCRCWKISFQLSLTVSSEQVKSQRLAKLITSWY